MDILGPFPMATGQRRFVIVAIDYFTKWTKAEPLATITASKCEEFLWKNVVCCFGVPKILITDNGKQFDNSNFRSFCEGLSISLRFTSVAHPQSNGQTENMNRSILQGLKRKLDDAKGAWVDELPKVLWAYRTTPHSVTGETPFLLCFGTEALLPVKVGLPTVRVLQFSEAENEENLRGNLDLLDDVRAQALDRMISTKQRVARFYNRRVRMRIFRVGDLVLRKLEVSDPKAAVGKLSPNWEGPYKISKVLRPGAYSLETLSGEAIPRTWNADNLRQSIPGSDTLLPGRNSIPSFSRLGRFTRRRLKAGHHNVVQEKTTKLGKQISILRLEVLDLLIKFVSLAFGCSLVSLSITGHVHRHREPVLHLAAIAVCLKRDMRMGHSRVAPLYGPSGTENWILLDGKILNHQRGRKISRARGRFEVKLQCKCEVQSAGALISI
ncbi:hypothetical protein RJ639_044120 [Escallonia herrerae]|uniref:Integrase catalytic domain-containing protein n=1 Tax=Escallonia herrerae TaxID=1293975 RepID=A0AA89B248_9ASTE|nr:hypothetical protein RJ639_044120 [Escallonia herrerae]